MIASNAFSGKRYAVLGLARSGRATVDALLASGAEVVAWDEREEARNKLAPPLQGRGWGGACDSLESNRTSPAPNPSPEGEGLTFADPLTLDLTAFDGVVVSPGVPLNRHPIAAHARAAGVPLIGDIELFAQARPSLPPHKVVGITGTNGKSTTTALVHHILKTAGVPTTMGGNIGLPILAQDPLPAGGVYVLELSSYQIDLTQSLDCDVAVLLNITPDHLDRYESFEAYAASKARLFEMQSEGAAVVATDDTTTRSIAHSLSAFVSSEVETRWSRFRRVSTSLDTNAERVIEVNSSDVADQSHWPSLQGPHNAQNATAAVAVARWLEVDDAVIERGLASYPGLPHRMERVAERGGILFVNDSKATNPTSTAPALAAYPAVRWILGGRAKTDELDACAPHFGRVRSAYTIGEAGPLFARILGPHMPVAECGVLDEAVRRAANDAEAGDVVLLSPACASFDQFKDYEARGDAFREAVGAL